MSEEEAIRVDEDLQREFVEQVRRELREQIQQEEGPAEGEEDREVVIELEDVCLAFGDHRVLDEVCFQVHRGETLCVLGGSGAGKSTILRIILRLTLPDLGRVLVNGLDITSLDVDSVAEIRERMGMVFQAAALFDSMNVFDNVAFPLHEHTEMPATEIRERVRQVLTFVDLDPDQVMDLLPAELSGGMKKRVGIARAIAHEPEILLFDEPTSGLDPITTRTINDLIVKLRRELSVSSVVVTHDIRSAFHISNRTALLHEGRIVFQGAPEEMIASEDEYVQEFIR